MGNLILVFLLLLNLFTGILPSAGGTTTNRDPELDHYMDLLERRDERGPVSVDEQVRVLAELGLAIPDDVVEETREFFEEYDFYGMEYSYLLESAGWGNYDYQSGEWTPSSHQIYSFDAEVFDIENMYHIYLQGLQSISEGELTFRDITVDFSKADYENWGGVVDVRFLLNGEECRYQARFMGDWLDTNIRSEINRCLALQGVEKRFYATDAMQGEIIFFCTGEWAKEFEEATLCYISDTVL